MSLFSKNIAANFLSNMWLTVLLLIATPMYIWLLGVESYGLIGFYLSLVAIVGFLDSGISATAMREMAWLEARPEERDKISVLLRSLELVYWGIIIILGMGMLLGASFFGEDWFQTRDLEPGRVREAMMLMAVSLVVQVPSGLYVAGLMGLQRQVECSGLLAFFGTLRPVGAIAVLGLIASDIRLFFLWQIVVSALQTGYIRWFLWEKVRIEGQSAEFSPEILKSVKGFAAGMMLITATSIIMTQADKMILSKTVSLETLGFYMLAWTISSGLARVSTPLIQVFYPRFTELLSKGDSEELSRKLQMASQSMSVLILPPAALIVFLAQPILFFWTGNQVVAEGAAPILAFLVAGAVLASCSYPALSIIYGRKQLQPVIIVHLASLAVLLPLLIILIGTIGVMGAAFVAVFYGLIQYVAFQAYGLHGIPHAGLFSSMLKNFVVPGVVSLVVAGVAGYCLSEVAGKITFIASLSFALIVGWSGALFACKDLLKTVVGKMKWSMKTTH